MGVMPVNRLLITMSLPMMISMLVQALYNVVDSVFVSYISEDALAAVGLAFPAQNLMISVAVGTGVGINALLSKSLGEKNYDTANRTAVNGIFLAFCSWVAFAVLGGLFSRTVLLPFGEFSGKKARTDQFTGFPGDTVSPRVCFAGHAAECFCQFPAPSDRRRQKTES